MSCEDPDHPDNLPRNLFVWRSNLLGSSGKGHEYFLKHLLGTSNGVQGKDLGASDEAKPAEVVWHDEAPEGKLDLLVTLDFRMSTTCLYSRHRAADRDLVREERPQHHATCTRSSTRCRTAVDPVWQSQERLGDLQGLREEVLASSASAIWAWRRTWC